MIYFFDWLLFLGGGGGLISFLSRWGYLRGWMGVHGVFRTCEWLLSLSLCWFSALSLGVVVSIVRCERGINGLKEEDMGRRKSGKLASTTM